MQDKQVSALKHQKKSKITPRFLTWKVDNVLIKVVKYIFTLKRILSENCMLL